VLLPVAVKAERHPDARIASAIDNGMRVVGLDVRRLMEQHAISFFQRYRLADVRRRDVRTFAVYLQRQGLAPGSVLKVLAPVKAMFATAVEDGDLSADPTHRLIVNRRSEHEEEPEAKAMGSFWGPFPTPWQPRKGVAGSSPA
jgi:hypothetical protein